MSKVKYVMSVELKTGVISEDFEKFIAEEFYPNYRVIAGLKPYLQKGLRGGREGKYLFIDTYESVDRLLQLWPKWGEAGEEFTQWIAAHQEIWDKLGTFVEYTDHTAYVELSS